PDAPRPGGTGYGTVDGRHCLTGVTANLVEEISKQLVKLKRQDEIDELETKKWYELIAMIWDGDFFAPGHLESIVTTHQRVVT
ncbi:hypothetical protein HDU93_001151, partial [Gonapodya sp. JEL0774]